MGSWSPRLPISAQGNLPHFEVQLMTEAASGAVLLPLEFRIS